MIRDGWCWLAFLKIPEMVDHNERLRSHGTRWDNRYPTFFIAAVPPISHLTV